jgi:hypothetical protein
MASYLVKPGTSAEDLAAQREFAQSLLANAASTKPVGHWTQILAQMAQGGLGGYEAYELGQEGRRQQSEAGDLFNKAIQSLAGTGGATAAGSAAASPAAPMAVSPAQSAAAAAGRVIPESMPQIVRGLVGTESGGDPNARNPLSSATGRGQFINSTWLDMMKGEPEAQGKTPAEILAMRTNPAISDRMTGKYAEQNAAALRASGMDVTPGTIKLAHTFGPAGARSILSSRDNVPVAQVMPANVMQANPWIGNKTVGELKTWADRAMAREMRVAGNAAPAAAQGAEIAPARRERLYGVAQKLLGNPRTQAAGQAILLKLIEQDAKADGTVERGTTAHAMTDANGNVVYGTIGKDGSWKPLSGAQGYRATPKTATSDTGTEIITHDVYGNEISRTRKDVAGKERAEEIGKAGGQAQADLPRVENNASTIFSYIDSLASDPYLPSMTGPVQSRLPNLSGDAARVQSKADQVGGQAFLQAFSALKGAGQITETEGAKATAALSRLQAMGVNDADYATALSDFRREVVNLLEVARAKARSGASNPDAPRPVKTLRFNPQTGELE